MAQMENQERQHPDPGQELLVAGQDLLVRHVF